MSDKQESARERRREPVQGEACAGIMQEMMSRCAEMMPDMVTMCGRAGNDEDEFGTRAACCSRSGG